MGFPVHIALLLLLLLVINWLTFTGEWWVHWVALGLGVAWAITAYRFSMIRLMTSKGAWWMKWALVALGVAWVVSLIRVIGSLFGR